MMMMTPPTLEPPEPPRPQDDRLLAPTRWTAIGVIPVLVAAFVILYGFPHRTTQLWGWMVCPSMSALIMGGGYLSGAYFFTRVASSRQWHRVSAGFVGTTVFSSILMAITIIHWDVFNHDHVSFWAWLLLYASTPVLLPILFVKNQRTDPQTAEAGDVRVPRGLRTAVGIGGAFQLGVAAVMLFWPAAAARVWPWVLDVPTIRSLAAFVAFPAVTWVWFLVDDRWSSFRITQHTATIGLVLLTLAALRAQSEFRSDAWFAAYIAALVVAIVLNVMLYVAMERRRPAVA